MLISPLVAADVDQRKVDPSILHRYVPDVRSKPSDLSTSTCAYKPIFGVGDSAPNVLKGVRRFGEITVGSGGSCKPVNYPAEEQIFVIMEGAGTLQYGGETAPVKKDDFLYLPAGIQHGIANKSASPLRVFAMGFKVPAGTPPPPKLQIASLGEIKPQTVGGHPDSVVYQLMMGNTSSKRDRLASAHL